MWKIVTVGILVAFLAGCGQPGRPASTVATPPTQAAPSQAAEPSATSAPAVSPLPTGTTPSSASPLPTPATSGAGEPAIHVVRSGGFAGKTEEWTIYANGQVASSTGDQHSVPPEQVQQVGVGLLASGLFNAGGPGGLGPGSCRDCYNYVITVSGGGQSQTVRFTENPGTMTAGQAAALGQLNKMLAKP